MNMVSLARVLVTAGVLLLAAGGLVYLAARFGWQLGRLPGDIRIEREGFALYIPLTTFLIISLLLTVLLNLLGRLFRQ